MSKRCNQETVDVLMEMLDNSKAAIMTATMKWIESDEKFLVAMMMNLKARSDTRMLLWCYVPRKGESGHRLDISTAAFSREGAENDIPMDDTIFEHLGPIDTERFMYASREFSKFLAKELGIVGELEAKHPNAGVALKTFDAAVEAKGATLQ
jgi:hypothetical protein